VVSVSETQPFRSGVTLASVFEGFRDPTVLALGLTQAVGYGTIYYAFGVLAPRIGAEFGLGLDWMFGLYSGARVLASFCAPRIGRSLDQHGARTIMSCGSVLVAVAMLICAISPNVWVFSFSTILMEMAGCMVLYEAAFASLTQIFGQDARRRITAITLLGGLASTIFWPLTQALSGSIGWRWTYAVFALAHCAVAMTHWQALRQARPLVREALADRGAQPVPVSDPEAQKLYQRQFMFFTMAICASAFVYSSFSMHVLRIIEGEGFSIETAALIAMLIGPAQVLARMAEIFIGQRFNALMTGFVALGMLVASIVVLLLSSGSFAGVITFVVLYGLSQGLITIARGTVPLLLFGAQGYATRMGRVQGFNLLVKAIAPFGFALLLSRLGLAVALGMTCAAAIAALIAFATLRQSPRIEEHAR
jgi:predicted MFS family arabinose efflux permease